MQRKKVILAGGSGFLGRTLSAWYAALGYEVVVLSRRETVISGARTAIWDGRSPGTWCQELDGAVVLINLAGRSVNCRYNNRNRLLIMNSRIASTRALGEALAHCSNPPPVWLNAGTATIYRHTYGEPHGENGVIGATPEAKDAFSIEVARAWEAEFENAKVPSTRKILLRTAMVFGKEPGGVFTVLQRLTQMGLGGKMAHGRQHVSWIHAEDFCRALDWLISRPEASGIYNIAAPNPLTNAEMMAAFRRVYKSPLGLPAARWMLEIGAFFMGTETELILKSRRVVPARLLKEGFEFRYPDLETALLQLAQT